MVSAGVTALLHILILPTLGAATAEFTHEAERLHHISDADSLQCNASLGAVCQDNNTTTLASGLSENIPLLTENATSSGKELSLVRFGIFFECVVSVAVVAYIGAVIKFAIDGSLPARLYMWGVLPEYCAAISVRSIVALLRLKTEPTTAIVLRQCIDDAEAVRLADAIIQYGSKAQLQVVELPCHPKLSEEGLRAILVASLRKDSQVAEFDISFNPQIGDKAVETLRPFLEAKTPKLQNLRLAACGLSPIGLESLAEVATFLRLTTLDLGGNDFAGAGETLAGICEAPLLEEFRLACCGLKVEDVRQVAEQLPFTSIKSLQLGGNGFGSPGVIVLSEHLPASMINELCLEHNGIDREVLSTLGSAWFKRPFSRINLKGNNMTPEEIHQFFRTLTSTKA